ncbi:hypothetical protein ACFFGT_05050 [Mucilaginibacter angelicae]|uniref:Uncharacterized protein n=1 Tax=Mucilaginibacter angelicae TaxID=869718 RepID=A0ABV6L1E2_9SPHI
MNYNVVALEISDLIAHFTYFDGLVSDAISKSMGSSEEQTKIRNKSKDHLEQFFAGTEFFDGQGQVLPLTKTKGLIIAKLEGMKNKEVHELVEKLEKDAKKIKKLYLSLTK